MTFSWWLRYECSTVPPTREHLSMEALRTLCIIYRNMTTISYCSFLSHKLQVTTILSLFYIIHPNNFTSNGLKGKFEPKSGQEGPEWD
jgi:hypothetical protein